MKLLNKTGIYYIIGAAIVFTIGGFVFFYFLNSQILRELGEKLQEDKAQFEKQLLLSDSLPEQLFWIGEPLQIKKVSATSYTNEIAVIDTMIYNKFEDEILPYRQLRFYGKSKCCAYRIILNKSLVESEDLITAIIYGMVALFALFLVFLFFLNRFVSKALWKPFYKNLQNIKTYDLTRHDELELVTTTVEEFEELNIALGQMTNKIRHDYDNMKEFTENASHEIQTPLAIIKSKLEYLIQSENLKPAELQHIQAVYEAANRLSRLNQSLILLTKIENNQFSQKEKINISDAVKKQINHYKELAEARELTLKTDIADDVFISINPLLLDILISNLFTNAIKHNIKNGEIMVLLGKSKMSISNTGPALEIDPTSLFERFKKGMNSSESLGLGLSIVKKIVLTSGLKINYSFNNGIHTLEIE